MFCGNKSRKGILLSIMNKAGFVGGVTSCCEVLGILFPSIASLISDVLSVEYVFLPFDLTALVVQWHVGRNVIYDCSCGIAKNG